MTTPIADMVERMLATGVAHEVIVLAVRTAETSRDATVTRHGTSRSNDAVRAARYRAKRKQNQQKPEAADVAMAVSDAVTSDRDASRDVVTNAPLPILPSFELSQEPPKEEKKEVVQSTEPRAKAKRGARLPDDWQPTADDQAYAAGRGLRLYEIEIEATKFRNYWTNRTDKQAAKPRWDRAWQNWILNVRKSPNGPEKSVLTAFDRLEQELAGGDDLALRQDDLLRLPAR